MQCQRQNAHSPGTGSFELWAQGIPSFSHARHIAPVLGAMTAARLLARQLHLLTVKEHKRTEHGCSTLREWGGTLFCSSAPCNSCCSSSTTWVRPSRATSCSSSFLCSVLRFYVRHTQCCIIYIRSWEDSSIPKHKRAVTQNWGMDGMGFSCVS